MSGGRFQPFDTGCERSLEGLGAFRHRLVQGLGALRHRLVQSGRALRHGGFQRGEILGRAFNHPGEAPLFLAETFQQARHGFRDPLLCLVHLVGGLARTGDEKLGQLNAALGKFLVDGRGRSRDVARDLCADALQRFAHSLAVIGKCLALGGQFVDEVPHADFVLAIGALKRGNLAVHHGFELACPADGARDGVVHRRDLASDGLSDRSNRLLGEPVGLSQPDGDLGHGRGHEAQFLGAPHEQREEPEDGDGDEDGDGGGQRRRAAEHTPACFGDLVRDQPKGKKAADEEPSHGRDERHQEWRACRPLLEGKNQPAD